jgi:hypothetical protein
MVLSDLAQVSNRSLRVLDLHARWNAANADLTSSSVAGSPRSPSSIASSSSDVARYLPPAMSASISSATFDSSCCNGTGHELAKELKDAGFPQEGEGLYVPRSVPDGGDYEKAAYLPILEELIEACESNFQRLELNSHPAVNEWHAFGSIDEAKGPTPTEAVARLWLALQKK